MRGAYPAGLALAFLLALMPGALAHAADLTFTTVSISSNNASTTLAKAGDRITLHVIASQELNKLTDPVRYIASSTIAGHDLTVQCSNWAGNADCSVEYTMQDGDAEGAVPLFFSAEASNGNDWGEATSTTDGSFVEFDNSAPTIGVTNADAIGYALSKSISATVTDAHPASFEEATTTGGCNTPGIVFFDYPSGTPLTFTSEADNGKKVCFRATDALGHTSEILSEALAHIGTDPNPAPAITSATITLRGSNPMTVVLGNAFTDPGATAVGEPGDVDLTSSISTAGSDAVNTSQIGTYHLHYAVFDSSNVTLAEMVRTVVVSDPYAPVITLNGDASMTLTEGDAFTDPGATANDPQDGDVPVAVSGSVDTSRAGTYTLTYTATDSSNNTSTATRTVTVEAKPVHHSGGGGGHSGSSVVATTTLSGGEVLGAATYNFMTDLKVGSGGADVTALQQILITGGYLAVPSPTGYFGLGTQAAVEAYQAAHGITPASGYVGPLTRAALSAGSVQSGMAIDRPAMLLQIAELLKQVAELQAQLAKMQQ